MKKTIHVNSAFLLLLLVLLFFSISSSTTNMRDFYLIYALFLSILVVSSINIYFIFRCLYHSYLSFKPIILSASKTQNFESTAYTENKTSNFEREQGSANQTDLNKRYKPITFIPALCFSFIFIGPCHYFMFSYELFDNFFLFLLLITYLLYFLLYFSFKELFTNLNKKKKYKLIVMKVNQFLEDNLKKILLFLKYYYNKIPKKYKILNRSSKKARKNMEEGLLVLLAIVILFSINQMLFYLMFHKFSLLFFSMTLTVTCFIVGLIYAFCDLDNKWHYSKISHHWLRSAVKNYYVLISIYLIPLFTGMYLLPTYFDVDIEILEYIFVFNINWYDILLLICSGFFFPLGVNLSYLFIGRKAVVQ